MKNYNDTFGNRCTGTYHTKKEGKDVIGLVCALCMYSQLCMYSHFSGERIFKKIVLFQLFFLLTPPIKMEKTVCSETPIHKIQSPGESPKRKKTTFRAR